MMDIFGGRSSFQGGNGLASGRAKVLGCPECEELKRKAKSVGSQIPESELACSKCRRKKSFSYTLPAEERADDIEMMAGMGQAAPVATEQIAAPAPKAKLPSWVGPSVILGLVAAGIMITIAPSSYRRFGQ